MITGHHVSPANSIVFPHRHKVCVSASFNPEGNIRIDAWGIEFDGKRFRYKVESTTITENVGAYIKFHCKYVEFGLLKSIDLMFYTRDHRWTTE